MKKKIFLIGLLALLIFSAFGYNFTHTEKLRSEHLSSSSASMQSRVESDFYLSKIQPIFNARCIVCHACYDSPCQVDLTSYEGVRRGAHKKDIYDFPKLKDNPPSRLGIDGHSLKDWRKKGFYSIIPDQPRSVKDGLSNSALWTLVNMRERHFENENQNWDSSQSRMCPNENIVATNLTGTMDLNISELDLYRENFANRGMPFGFPPLNESELATLKEWLEKGAPGPRSDVQEALELPGRLQSQILSFEHFFNGMDFKSRLTARYIYEHLFLAHIYFEKEPRSFFRLVRAQNEVGAPIEIATTRPYDNPGKRFYYRLKRYTGTVVHKNHIPYLFSAEKLATWKRRFLQSQWARSDETWPAYGEAGSNPFATFIAIPPEARSRFMLEDSHYHVMTFIKGPVCNGSVAVSVIEDHFWVMFMNPERDVTVTQPEFFEKNANLMQLPAGTKSIEYRIEELRNNTSEVNKNKYALYRQLNPQGLDLSAIWDGDQNNPNALLTVYRHNDSASVLKGAQGGVPKTVWVLDYPIFEDIYYNLVAGYNVFGPLLHQVLTRKYMDHSRVDSEDLFINMLPRPQRPMIRSAWTRKSTSKSDKLDFLLAKVFQPSLRRRMEVEKPNHGLEMADGMSFSTSNPKVELLQRIFSQRFNSRVRGSRDPFSCCSVVESEVPREIKSFADAEKWFALISGKPQKFSVPLPDVGYVRVSLADGGSRMYTLIHNKAHFNVSFMTFEDIRRDTQNDSVDFVPGYAASYPNMYFDVQAETVPQFVRLLQALDQGPKARRNLIEKFGVPRSSNRFWEFSDWVHQDIKKVEPIEGAVLDLSRYADF